MLSAALRSRAAALLAPLLLLLAARPAPASRERPCADDDGGLVERGLRGFGSGNERTSGEYTTRRYSAFVPEGP